MTIELPFNTGDTVFYSLPHSAFNKGTVKSIECEIFIKIDDETTGQVIALRPNQVHTWQQEKDYLDSLSERLVALKTEAAEA